MNLQPVKMGLQRMTCPEHHEHPEVTILFVEHDKTFCDKIATKVVQF